jgi:hypothetical protein
MNDYYKMIDDQRIKCEVNNRINILRLFLKDKSPEGQARFDRRYNDFMQYMNRRYGDQKKYVYVAVKRIYHVNI